MDEDDICSPPRSQALSDTEQALEEGFDEVDFVRADAKSFRARIHVYERAQRLRGPSDLFEEFEVRLWRSTRR